jgi:hypothetical protein
MKLFDIFEDNVLENQLYIYQLYKNILLNLINDKLDFIYKSNKFIKNNIKYFNLLCLENTFEVSLDKYLYKMKTEKLQKLPKYLLQINIFNDLVIFSLFIFLSVILYIM